MKSTRLAKWRGFSRCPKVLGTGCASCKITIEIILDIANKKGLEIELEKIEKLAEIVAAGVMSTPAIMINGEVVHAGGIPSKDKIQAWLR